MKVSEKRKKVHTLKSESPLIDTPFTQVYLGDCAEQLQDIGSSSIDLIVTSPPYADQRSKT